MKKFSAVLVLLAASLALVACGGSGSSSSSSSSSSETGSSESASAAESGSTIKFEANPEGQLMFTTMKASGKAGDDTIDFVNPSTACLLAA